MYYTFFALSKCDISSALLHELKPSSHIPFIELFNQLLLYYTPWDDSPREQWNDYTLNQKHYHLKTLFSHLPVNHFLPLVTAILQNLSSLPKERTITSYCIGVSSTVPSIGSLSKQQFQVNYPVYSCLKDIPNLNEYEEMTFSLFVQCQSFLQLKQNPGVICWILDCFCKLIFTKRILEKFIWFLSSHTLFCNQHSAVYDCYLLFFAVLIKQVPAGVSKLVITRMWPVLFNRMVSFWQKIQSSHNQQETKSFETTASHILTLLRIFVDCDASIIPVTATTVKQCFEWILIELDTHQTKLYMEVYYLLTSLSRCATKEITLKSFYVCFEPSLKNRMLYTSLLRSMRSLLFLHVVFWNGCVHLI